MATELLRPNAAGDECNIISQVGDACPNHYLNVDEESHDSDTTVVYEAGATFRRDFYNIDNSGIGAGTITKITVYNIARANTTPTQTNLKVCIKSGTGAGAPDTASESAEKTTTDTYASYDNEWATNPATSAAWTWEEIDALQIGCSIREPVDPYSTLVTQVYVVVDYQAYQAGAKRGWWK